MVSCGNQKGDKRIYTTHHLGKQVAPAHPARSRSFEATGHAESLRCSPAAAAPQPSASETTCQNNASWRTPKTGQRRQNHERQSPKHSNAAVSHENLGQTALQVSPSPEKTSHASFAEALA